MQFLDFSLDSRPASLLCFYFWLISSFTLRSSLKSYVHRQHFRLRFLVSLCLVFFGAVHLFISDLLLVFNMVWPCIFCGTGFVGPQSRYRDMQRHDILDFCLLSVVTCFAYHLDLSSIWGHYHHVHLVDDRSASWLLYFSWLHATCHTVLTRLDQIQTAVHGCNLWLSKSMIPFFNPKHLKIVPLGPHMPIYSM